MKRKGKSVKKDKKDGEKKKKKAKTDQVPESPPPQFESNRVPQLKNMLLHHLANVEGLAHLVLEYNGIDARPLPDFAKIIDPVQTPAVMGEAENFVVDSSSAILIYASALMTIFKETTTVNEGKKLLIEFIARDSHGTILYKKRANRRCAFVSEHHQSLFVAAIHEEKYQEKIHQYDLDTAITEKRLIGHSFNVSLFNQQYTPLNCTIVSGDINDDWIVTRSKCNNHYERVCLFHPGRELIMHQAHASDELILSVHAQVEIEKDDFHHNPNRSPKTISMSTRWRGMEDEFHIGQGSGMVVSINKTTGDVVYHTDNKNSKQGGRFIDKNKDTVQVLGFGGPVVHAYLTRRGKRVYAQCPLKDDGSKSKLKYIDFS